MKIAEHLVVVQSTKLAVSAGLLSMMKTGIGFNTNKGHLSSKTDELTSESEDNLL